MLLNGENNDKQHESFVYLDVYDVSLGIDLIRSDFETMANFEKLFDFVASRCNSHKNVLQWLFLTKWHQLDFDEKLDKYQEYLSYELHLFTFKNDSNFFHNVCLNHIKSKLYYDGMIIFLHDINELLSYIESYHRFTKLNLCEQIVILDYFNKRYTKTSMLNQFIHSVQVRQQSESEKYFEKSYQHISAASNSKQQQKQRGYSSINPSRSTTADILLLNVTPLSFSIELKNAQCLK